MFVSPQPTPTLTLVRIEVEKGHHRHLKDTKLRREWMMATALDITRLPEVRKRMGKHAIRENRAGKEGFTKRNKRPLPRTKQGPITDGAERCFWQGDYELFKTYLQIKQYPIVETGSSTSASSESASSHRSPDSVRRPSENCFFHLKQVYANERLAQEYRQRVIYQEKKADALYSQLFHSQQRIQSLRQAQEELLRQYLNCSLGIVTTCKTSIMLKIAMFSGLIFHWMGGSPNCLAMAVFGWWLSESFS
jgi:hypothetical protein